MSETIRILKRMKRFATQRRRTAKSIKMWDEAMKQLHTRYFNHITPMPTITVPPPSFLSPIGSLSGMSGPAGHLGPVGPFGPRGNFFFPATKAHYKKFLRINSRKKKMYLWEFEDSGYARVDLPWVQGAVRSVEVIQWLNQRCDRSSYVYFLDRYFFFADPKMATLFAIKWSS